MSITLYAIPFSCSLASHIALREAQLPHSLAWVTRGSLSIDGDAGGLLRVNPKGKVPALVLEGGEVLTENVAVLAWLAERSGHRVDQRMLMWLGFIATELHKQVLFPSFDPVAPEATKLDVVQRLLPKALEIPAAQLEQAPFLTGGEQPSPADFYLLWALLLFQHLGVELAPSLLGYRDRLLARESVAAAVALERRKLKGDRS